MDEQVFLEIVKLYKSSLDNKLNDEELIKKIEELIGDYSGFFFKKTIYRVIK